MILQEWNNLDKIRRFFLEKNFIEIPYKCSNPQLNTLQNVYFRTGLSKYAIILDTIQLNPYDPNPSEVIELYKKEEEPHRTFQTDLVLYLILISPDRKKTTFANLVLADAYGRIKTLTKDLSKEDLIFEKKLNKLKFNHSEKYWAIFNKSFESIFENDNEDNISEEIIKDLIEERDKISIDLLQNMFNFQDSKKFHFKVLEWAKKFRLIIDSDYLITTNDELGFVVEELDRKYEDWKKLRQKK